MVATVAQGDHRNVRRLGISVENRRQLMGVDFPQAGGAQNGRRSVILQHGQRVAGLRAMYHLKTFKLQCFRDSPGKEDVGIDQQNFGWSGDWRTHAGASMEISFSRSTISTVSFPIA